MDILQDYFPEKLNNTKKHYTLTQILEILKESMNHTSSVNHDGHSHGAKATASPTVASPKPVAAGTPASPTTAGLPDPSQAPPTPARVRRAFDQAMEQLLYSSVDSHAHRRVRRAAGGHGEHSLLEELTHIFHLASLAILSFLVFVVSLTVFCSQIVRLIKVRWFHTGN